MDPHTLRYEQAKVSRSSRRSLSPLPLQGHDPKRAPSPVVKADSELAPPLPVVISVKECVLRRKDANSGWGFTLRGTKSGYGKDKWIYNCFVEGISKNGSAEVSYPLIIII